METAIEQRPDLQEQLDHLNAKLDRVLDHIQEQERARRVREELQDEMVRIGREAFQGMVVELDEVAHHFDNQDVWYLVKNLMRNVNTLTALVEQMESATDLLEDVRPLGKDMFNQALERFDELDRKGYFAFLQELSLIADEIVTSFSVDDVRLLRKNITGILLTVKNMTQPEMLDTVNVALDFYRHLEAKPASKVTYRQLLRELRKPETRRGMAFLIEFLQRMSATDGSGDRALPTPNDKALKEAEA